MGTAAEFLPCLTCDIGLAAAESLWCGVSANSGYTNIPFPVPSVQKIIFISGGGVAKTGSTPEVWIGMTRFGNILPISFNGTLSITFAELYHQPRMRWRSLVHWRIAFIGKPFKLQEEVTRKLQIGGGAFYSHNSSPDMFNQKGEDRGGKSSIKLPCGNGKKTFIEIHGIGNKLTSPQPSLVWNFDALAFRSCVCTY